MHEEHDRSKAEKHPEAHEHDRLPTSSAITGAAAAGVWGPRSDESSLLKPHDAEGGPPSPDDPLEPPAK